MCDHLNSTIYASNFTIDLSDSGELDILYSNNDHNIYESDFMEINYCPICGEPIQPNETLNDYAVVDFDKNEIVHTIAGVYEIDAMEALETIIRESYTPAADLIRFTHIAEAKNEVVITRLK